MYVCIVPDPQDEEGRRAFKKLSARPHIPPLKPFAITTTTFLSKSTLRYATAEAQKFYNSYIRVVPH